jgi:quercetin dioxygenase-like cupin family protein
MGSARGQTIYRIAEHDPAVALANKDVTHTTLRTENALLYFGAVKPRQDAPVAPYHNHPFDKIIAVFKGELTMDINGEKHVLTAGSAVVIPAFARHAGFVAGREPYFGVEVCAPVRRDYAHLAAHQTESFSNPGVLWAQPGSNSWQPGGGADLAENQTREDCAGARTIYTIRELNPAIALADAKASHSALRASRVLLYFGAVAPKRDGAVHHRHNHPYDTLLVVLGGSLKLEINGVMHALSGGSAVIIPAGASHAGYVDGDEPYVGFEVFAPVRSDYVSLTHHQRERFADPGVPWVRPGSTSWDPIPA